MKQLLLFCGLFFALAPATAQLKPAAMAEVTTTYAFTGATLIPEPGEEITNATVVVEDGVITAAGKRVSVPTNAKVIPSDSLYIYAGLIAATANVASPEIDFRQMAEDMEYAVASPPNKLAGITPEKTIRDIIDPSDEAIGKMRDAGFTMAHLVPKGRMLPGSGALVLFNNDEPSEVVFRPQTAQFMQLKGMPRRLAYPSTLIAVIAKYRELYEQAEIAMDYEQQYAANPDGLEAPKNNPVLQAFYPVINKKQPVFIRAEKVLEAHRALDLQTSTGGFNLVITELQEGWDLAPTLKNRNVPVCLSLHLPELQEMDSTQTSTLTEAEEKALKERQKEMHKKYLAQAATFEDAGIPFAFSALEVKPDEVRKNLRKMIENGLSEEAALAALTTHAAGMLGISANTGTVTAGKMGNLTITDQPLFREESAVKYLMINGTLYTNNEKEQDTKAADASSSSDDRE